MKVLWLIAPVVLAVACSTTHPGTQVHSAPPIPAVCQGGVGQEAQKLMQEQQTDPAQANKDYANASPSVVACLHSGTIVNQSSATASSAVEP